MTLENLLWGLVPQAIIVLIGLCLVVTSIGFYRTVYFISLGYGFSVAAMSVLVLVLGWSRIDPITGIQALLLGAYGLRLGIYLFRREKLVSYRASLKGDRSEGGPAFVVKLAIWVWVAIQYPLQFTPALARAAANAAGTKDVLPALSIVGLAVMATGLALEGIADAQKNAAKKKAPERFCDSGLYRVVRCPNYLGELLLWTGNLLAGASLLSNWALWLMASLGYGCIFFVMIGSTRRLELKQEGRYGSDPEYQAYVKRVPIIFPLVPIYSLKRVKVFVG